MTDDMNDEESIETPVELYIGSYTYIGVDAEGYHHHADGKNARVIVIDDNGRQVGEHGSYIRLDGDVDHVHIDDGFQYAYGLEAWADHVADARGWDDRQLYTAPKLRKAFHSGGHLTGGKC